MWNPDNFAWLLDQQQWTILAHVVAAGVMGAIIGIQRELAHKPAGLRTHLLVAAAAAALVELGPVIVAQYAQTIGDESMRSDPLRVVEAVITGVTFLGAGTIIFQRDRRSVEGLTTAASILVAAIVGMLVASHLYIVAGAMTVFALLALVTLKRLERRSLRNDNPDKS